MEASAYERMYRLSRQLQFASYQTPSLAVFSADNDFPRRYLFPIGRFLSALLVASGEPGDRERDNIVVGRYSNQVTHRISFEPDSALPTLTLQDGTAPPAHDSRNPFLANGDDCKPITLDDDPRSDELAAAIARNPRGADPTAEWRINGKHLMPTMPAPQPTLP